MMMRSFLASLLVLLVLILTPVHASDDWFTRLDTQFEDSFTATDAAFERALTEGVAELDAELADIWGQARQLPSAKTWIGYSTDRQSRVTVDYDKGEISVERFDASEPEAVRDLQQTLFDDSETLNQRALLRRRLIEKTRRLRPQSPRPRPWRDPESAPNTVPPTAEVTSHQRAIQWQPRRNELATLIEPNQRPVFVKRSLVLPDGRTRTVTKATLPLRKDRDQLSAQALADPVRHAAEKYNLPQALILSVIKNESAFNPRARSQANAMGLMQLVATSGGKDAYAYLYGEKTPPPAEVLYDPYENIMLGATYLHLLNTRYFGKVTNPETRRHLVIAAYNTGAGNVAKAFTGAMKLRPAIEKINTLSPQAVYDHLRVHLPYEETRTYLAKVNRDLATFAQWDQQTG